MPTVGFHCIVFDCNSFSPPPAPTWALLMTQLKYQPPLKRCALIPPAESKSAVVLPTLFMLPSVTFWLTCRSLCSGGCLRSNTSCQNSVIMLSCYLFCPTPLGSDIDSSSHTTSVQGIVIQWGNEQMAETKCRMLIRQIPWIPWLGLMKRIWLPRRFKNLYIKLGTATSTR